MRHLIAGLTLILLASACTGTGETPSTISTAEPASPLEGQVVDFQPSEGVVREEPDPDAPVDDLVAGINGAGFELWREQSGTDNLVFSPLSIGHAVLMARAAADQETVDRIDTAFGFPDGLAAHEAWNALDRAMAGSAEAEDEIVLSIADRIWPRLDVTPDQDWVDLLVAQHDVSVEGLDYVADPDGARDIINRWVAEQTADLIPELLPEDFLNPRTLLVLTDAVYFEARWQRVFGKYGPVEGEFTRLDGSTVPVSYMQELELGDRRGSGEGFVGAEIPYIGGDYSMLVLVPDEGRFQEIRDGLNHDFLAEVDAAFTTGPYELLVPQWETDTQIDLIDWLTELGAAPGRYPAIDPAAELAGAVHGADIAVDEEGTVAAAATALGFEESGAPQSELTVRADRPFLYVIRHRPTGAVLFAGQVTDPAS